MKNVVFELTFSSLQFSSRSEAHQRKQSWRKRIYFTGLFYRHTEHLNFCRNHLVLIKCFCFFQRSKI